MTVREALHRAEKRLRRAGVGSPGTDACLLMAHALKVPLSALPPRLREPLPVDHAAQFSALVDRRCAREPLAYIVGDTEFMSLRFLCRPAVFIPRPDTETLVEAVLEVLRPLSGPLTVAELGTGSGCIAVSVAHFLPQAQVIATDLSPAALELARENARLNGVNGRVRFLEGADLEPLRAAEALEKLVAVVSNPPYIPHGEIANLEPEVGVAEPRLALDGGTDGLDFYRRVLPQLAQLPRLRLAAFEFGVGQEDALAQLAEAYLPHWRIEILPDLGHLPRVLRATAP